MRIIVDANIVLAALIKDSTTRSLILFLEAEFYFPEPLLKELDKYKALVQRKANLTDMEFDKVSKLLFEYIQIAGSEELMPHLPEANQVMDVIDRNDAPVLACAIAKKPAIIWSTDAHFQKQGLIKVVTTKELLSTYKKVLDGELIR
jgi:predicted nucleic acid-binding protein